MKKKVRGAPYVGQGQIARIGHAIGIGGQKNRIVFEGIGRFLGTPWDGTKKHGKQLAWNYLQAHGLPARVGSGSAPLRKCQAPSGVASDAFLMSYAWRQLRMRVLVKRGAVCECCGASASRDRARMNVDHIKPRRYFPALALEESNLQILCDACNHGKGNWYQTDWRAESMRPRLVPKAV